MGNSVNVVEDDELLELVMNTFDTDFTRLSENPTVSNSKVEANRVQMRTQIQRLIKQRHPHSKSDPNASTNKAISDKSGVKHELAHTMSDPKGKVTFEVSDNVGLDTIKLTQQLSAEAIKDHGCFRIAVSGGSFAKHFGNGLKELIQLKQNDIDLAKWKVFFADERCVANDDDDSNYKGFKTQFMSNAKEIKPEYVFAIDDKIIKNSKKHGDESKKNDDNQDEEVMNKLTQQICESYGKDILREFGIKETDKKAIPQFDCIYLGMGPDGHTASLFPGHKLLQSSSNIVDFVVDSPKPPPFRITFGLPLICNAKNIIFVVTGSSKQDAVEQITGMRYGDLKQNLPAGIVTQNATGNVVWILDEEAACASIREY